MTNPKFVSNGQKYIPGIYGGLGPLAHTILENTLIEECNKRGISKDQQYPVWLLVSGSATPDRTISLSTNHDAFPYLAHYSKLLEKSGADFIVLACNTAHAYLPQLKSQVSVPFLSLIDSTLNSIQKKYPKHHRIGLLATTGTLLSEVYTSRAKDYGIEIVHPHPKSPLQKLIMSSIYHPTYGVKATGSNISDLSKENILEAVEWFKQLNCEVIIAGCTEISAIFSKYLPQGCFIVDPIKEVSKIIVDISYGSKSIHPNNVSQHQTFINSIN